MKVKRPAEAWDQPVVLQWWQTDCRACSRGRQVPGAAAADRTNSAPQFVYLLAGPTAGEEMVQMYKLRGGWDTGQAVSEIICNWMTRSYSGPEQFRLTGLRGVAGSPGQCSLTILPPTTNLSEQSSAQRILAKTNAANLILTKNNMKLTKYYTP